MIQLDYLAIGKTSHRISKAKALQELDVDQVLDLEFAETDTHRKGKTIRSWIRESVLGQLKDYVTSNEVKDKLGERKLWAHLVLIVGSRQIVIWDLDENGALMGEPKLAGITHV